MVWSMLLSAYDKSLNRYVVMLVSATDWQIQFIEENEEKDCVHSYNTDYHADCFKIPGENCRCDCTDR